MEAAATAIQLLAGVQQLLEGNANRKIPTSNYIFKQTQGWIHISLSTRKLLNQKMHK
jgi:uncharacterized protein YdeI (BOF family)